jgi:hypothetical protein
VLGGGLFFSYYFSLWRDQSLFPGHGELMTPSLLCGKNPEIGNLSILRNLTSNLVSKLLY